MNSTNDTIVEELYSKTLRYCVASFISFMGIAGLACNWLVAYVKIFHKKHYNGVTYTFMSQLAIADGIVLYAVSFCAAVFIVFPQIHIQYDVVQQIFGFVLNLGWHPGCCFLVLIAFSRYLALCHNSKIDVYFPNWIVKLCIFVPWISTLVFFCPQFFYPREYGKLTCWFPERMTWGNDLVNGSLGKYWMFVTMSGDFTALFFVVLFNFRSLFYLYKTRKQVQNFDQTTMRKREVKLFVQCFISGCCFFGIIGPFLILNILTGGTQHSIVLYLGMDVAWIFHHSLNPFIYVILNRKLRRHIINILAFKAEPSFSVSTTAVVSFRKNTANDG